MKPDSSDAGFVNKFASLVSALLASPQTSDCYDLVSFDVFDTVLSRKCGSYRKIFELVALDADLPHFADLRKSTELKLIRNSREEIRLDDIYQELDRMDASVDWRHVKALELETERRNLQPAGRAPRFLEQVRANGASIVFISDMYLGTDWIRSQLESHALWREGDDLFVSCDIGVNKRNGEIYQFVRDRYPGSKWLHVGDNLISDIVNAHDAGIDVRWMPNSYLDTIRFHSSNFLNRYRYRG